MKHTFTLIWKTVLGTCVLLVVFVALSLLWNFAMLKFFQLLGIPEDWLELPLVWIMLFGLLLIPKRFFKIRKPLRFQSSLLIEAPLQQVWNELMPSERDSFYLAGIERIAASPKSDRHFRFFIDENVAQVSVGQSLSVEAELGRVDPNTYLEYSYIHDQHTPDLVKFTTKSERTLRETADGVVVTMTEYVKGISYFMAFMFLLRNPCKDALKQLKAACEGTPDTSWAGDLVSRIKVEANGGPRIEDTSDMMVIGTTAIVVLMVAAFGAVGFVMHMTGAT